MEVNHETLQTARTEILATWSRSYCSQPTLVQLSQLKFRLGSGEPSWIFASTRYHMRQTHVFPAVPCLDSWSPPTPATPEFQANESYWVKPLHFGLVCYTAMGNQKELGISPAYNEKKEDSIVYLKCNIIKQLNLKSQHYIMMSQYYCFSHWTSGTAL